MNDLIESYKSNRGKLPLFSVFDLYDWYDGPISGVAKHTESGIKYFFETIAYDFSSGIRIYCLLQAPSEWGDKFNDQQIEEYLKGFLGDVFILKAHYINDVEYDLKEHSLSEPLTYKGIEEIANQNEAETKKWFSFFA